MFDIALKLLVEALIYPGLFFTILFVIFTQWIYRKLSARLQYRRGPIHAGPAGLLQPLADLLKLVSKKDLVNKYSSRRGPLIILSVAIGVVIVTQLMLPVAPWPISGDYDVLIALYFLLLAPFALAYLAVAHPNPYTSIGAARYLAQLFVSEPVFAASLIVPVYLSSKLGNSSFSIYVASLSSSALWTAGPIHALSMLLAAVAGFIAMMAILEVKPFDHPEAEAEIYWGVFTEIGGPRLALGFFLKFAERVVFPLLYVALFTGGAWPTDPSNTVMSAILLYLKTAIVFIALTIIDNILPRYKPEQAVRFLLKYAYPPLILSLILISFIT